MSPAARTIPVDSNGFPTNLRDAIVCVRAASLVVAYSIPAHVAIAHAERDADRMMR